ncbi:MAG: cofactor-independent phosphoglycerate mutase [Lentisphaerae bacterium]|nr:cofactor-independent phosphoglycerate mutase [Lentisphaerota bacterium]
MKIVILVGDGMGDYPLKELRDKTPLQVAAIPNIRRISAAGTVHLVQSVPDGMFPGSDVANLSLMGFDPRLCYTGRAPIEAAGAGIPMTAADVAFRCNLITVQNELIADHSAGHISTEEARPMIEELERKLGRDGLHFFTGTGYRHLVIWANGPCALTTTPPHDVLDQPVSRHLPQGERREELLRLMDASRSLLADHPVNRRRRQAGKSEATQIWLWGQGRRTALAGFRELYGLSGGVISAVDLVRGIGRLAGLEAVLVPGATGFVDTNYAGKVEATLKILQQHDFAFVHVEAPDECGHSGQRDMKIKAIEAFDREIVGPVWRALETAGRPYRLLICTDHRTPVAVRNHTAEAVPLAVLNGPVGAVTRETAFDEFVDGGRVFKTAFEWIQECIQRRRNL